MNYQSFGIQIKLYIIEQDPLYFKSTRGQKSLPFWVNEVANLKLNELPKFWSETNLSILWNKILFVSSPLHVTHLIVMILFYLYVSVYKLPHYFNFRMNGNNIFPKINSLKQMNAYNISGDNISKVSRENANIPLLLLSLMNSSSERILELLPFQGGLKELISILILTMLLWSWWYT